MPWHWHGIAPIEQTGGEILFLFNCYSMCMHGKHGNALNQFSYLDYPSIA